MMAAGRGEFFQSFLQGLEKLPVQAASPGRRPWLRGRGRSSPGGGPREPAEERKNRTRAAPRGHSHPEPRNDRKKTDFIKIQTSPSEENLVERLPPEILVKILSYLDVPSLLCISHVNKLFHRLANDDTMWHMMYMSEFGSHMWRPKLVKDAAVKESPAELRVEVGTDGHWKKMYFRTVAGLDIHMWRKELKDINPYTGLPRKTAWVLRNLNVSWELMLCDRWGEERTLEQSRAYFLQTSVVVRWSVDIIANYHHISSIQVYGVRKETPQSSTVRRPNWRSLIFKVDMKTQYSRFIGKDSLIKLIYLPPGVIIGVWRGHNNVAFIMVTLHFHKLVEKSLLGSPVCSYSEPVDRPPAYASDPKFGLHGYTLHFVLHTTGTEIMSGLFCQLSSRSVQIQRGLVELRVIDRSNLSQHRSLSGNVKLPWKSEALEGSVENCCIMTLTLLDEFHKPFWCLSSPVHVTMAKKQLSLDYPGEHFLMQHQNSDGQVKMTLVWLKEQKQFFLIGLSVYVSVFKVNKHFSRHY